MEGAALSWNLGRPGEARRLVYYATARGGKTATRRVPSRDSDDAYPAAIQVGYAVPMRAPANMPSYEVSAMVCIVLRSKRDDPILLVDGVVVQRSENVLQAVGVRPGSDPVVVAVFDIAATTAFFLPARV